MGGASVYGRNIGGRRSPCGRGGRLAVPRRRRFIPRVKAFLNRPKATAAAQAYRAARLISVNILLTLSSHSAPSVGLATLPISEKPAASAKSWYLLSSFWFAPAPGEPRPEGRRRPVHKMRCARRSHGHKREGADPRYPRIRAFPLTTRQPALRAATPGFTQAQHEPGILSIGSCRW